MAIPTSRVIRPCLSTKPNTNLSFLVPSIQCMRIAPSARFSTSPARCKKDNNSNRGVSAVRATGLRRRQTLSVREKDFKKQKLPTPVGIKGEQKGKRSHGLWGFFKDKKLLQPPTEVNKHGRAWTIGELRSRSWEVLHQLWWICVKERNRLATDMIERKRIGLSYGDHEVQERDKTVQETMKAIVDTLAERQRAYTEAVELAQQDPRIDLTVRDGPQWAVRPDEIEELEEPIEVLEKPSSEIAQAPRA